jgi:tRNA(adenine34) deaminase
MPADVDIMLLAVHEAELSLREGNGGFGAVIVLAEEIIAVAHDMEQTEHDPTAHAEMLAIKKASARLGRDLGGCRIFSTHEPCPMCSAAILGAGIDTVIYGYSIEEAIRQGRKRIRIPCREIFERAGKTATIRDGLCHDQCAILYDKAVREQIDRLRGADETALCDMAETLTRKRLAWLDENRPLTKPEDEKLLDTAYELFIHKLGILPSEAPIIERGPDHVSFASRNFCPTLEACKILGLDTRFVCRYFAEKPADALLRQIDPRLRFSRNKHTLRPYAAYCEETISLIEAD